MRLYVDNISASVSEDELLELFEKYGEVESIEIQLHQFGDKNRGYAYLEMPGDEEAMKAVDDLAGYILKNLALKVNPARIGVQNRRGTDRGGGRRLTDAPAF